MKHYSIHFTRGAIKELESLPVKTQGKILKAIEKLAETTRPPGSKKLHGGGNLYRIRVGDYRIIYQIEDGNLLILIVRVRHRKDAYQ